MAILKAQTTLILAGKVIQADETFECPEALANSLVARGFASNIKEVTPLTPEGLNTPQDPEKDPENSPADEIRADYAKLNKEELIEAAKAIGLNVPSKITKEKLIEVLVEAELEQGAE